MVYGKELIERLQREIERDRQAIADRRERIKNWETDEDDCFISQRVEERSISLALDKIRLLQDGGTAWFAEYATLDGTLVPARWCNTQYGSSLRAVMPDGSVVWTTATTKKGLEKKGLKKVLCRRPAWYSFHSSGSGMYGVYMGEYVQFPSDVNYATGEDAGKDPLEICEYTYEDRTRKEG